MARNSKNRGRMWLMILLIMYTIAFAWYFIYTGEPNTEFKISSKDTTLYPVEAELAVNCKPSEKLIVENQPLLCEWELNSTDNNASLQIMEVIIKKDGRALPLEVVRRDNSSKTFEVYLQDAGFYEILVTATVSNQAPRQTILFQESAQIGFEVKEVAKNGSEWLSRFITNELTFSTNTNHTHFECSDFRRQWDSNSTIFCTHLVYNPRPEVMQIISEINSSGAIVSDNFYSNNSSYWWTRVNGLSWNSRLYTANLTSPGSTTITAKATFIGNNYEEIITGSLTANTRINVLSRSDIQSKEATQKTINTTFVIAVLFTLPLTLQAIKSFFD